MLSGTCTAKKNIAMFLKSSVTGLLDYEIFDQKKSKQRIPCVIFKEMQDDGFAMAALVDYAQVTYQSRDCRLCTSYILKSGFL